jgi:hypothetical protein
MTYKFFIFVFFIYVIPFQVLKEIYLYDKDNFKIAKIINLLITLLLLLYITGPNNSIFELFYDFKSFKEAFQIDSGLINADITFIAKIIHNCLNFFMLFVVFNLTRRSEKFRRIFIYLLPLLFVLMIFEVNREFYREYNSNENIKNHSGLILILGSLWTSLRFIALFFIYNSKVFKSLMCLNNSKIKELMTKK